jgi:hypothetical protein
MTSRPVHAPDQVADTAGQLETLRWHIVRYDALRASLAARASFLLSANAVLIAGVALLVPQGIQRSVAGGRVSLGLLGGGSVVTLILSGISIRDALQAQFLGRPSRTVLGNDPPLAFVYHHSDALQQAPTYQEFASKFSSQGPREELTSALAALWIGLNAYSQRYRHMRRSAVRLYAAMTSFAISVTIAIVLIVLG